MAYILGIGAFGNDVRRLQEYLNDELSASLTTDGSYGGNTKTEVQRFRKRFGLADAPNFDEACFALSGSRGFAAPEFDLSPAEKSLDWPKKPPDMTSPAGPLMQTKCGKIEFTLQPISGNPEHIMVTNAFEAENIVWVRIPQLRNCIVPLDHGVTKTDGTIRFNKRHAVRLTNLFADWDVSGLVDRILTFDGSCELRLKRGSTKADIANLSNHAWGTAFDINATWNPRKSVPAMMGDRGCVRELVAIANANGFYWGGHFSTMDGMHFEVASEAL